MKVVDAADWSAEWTRLHAGGLVYLDFLTGVDRGDRVEVIGHAVDPETADHVLLGTLVTRGEPLDSLSEIFPGATWHERETSEMFGVQFRGLADSRPLLLRAGLGAPPMRKSTVLAARVAVEWPGTAEPGGSPGRRRQQPPGVVADWLEEQA